MKPRHFLFLFLLALNLNINAKLRLELIINFNDCVNCTSTLHAIKQLDTTVERIFVVNSKQKSYIKETLNLFGVSTNNYTKINYTDKILFTKNAYKSYCLVKNETACIDSFGLEMFIPKIQEINKQSKSLEKKLVLKDTFVVSDRVSALFNDGVYTLYDYNLNKVGAYRLNGNDIAYQRVFKHNEFSPKFFLDCDAIDRKAYNKWYGTLSYLGKTFPHFENTYFSDSMLYVLMNFSCPIFNEKGDTLLGGKLFVYTKNIYSNVSNLYCLKDNDLTSKLKKEIYLINHLPSFVKNKQYVFSLFSLKIFDENPIIANCELKNNMVNFLNTDKYSFSSEFMNKYDFKEKSNISVNGSLYFFNSFPYFIDIKKDTSYLYLDIAQKLNKSYYIRDMVKKGNQLKLLLFEDEKEKLVCYDLALKKIISSEEVNLPKTANINTAVFKNYSELIYLENDGKTIVIKTIE